ncbi:DUF3592 domain-containing protein [Kitasatospora sp. NPDC048545]|uniref:DUF3592 domain-containing protein n=1 Tax=Kitasatospora sp. NPDC048545 TaxID=3157208 RepID=UPI003404C0F1
MADDSVLWSVIGVAASGLGAAALTGVVLKVRLRARTLAQGLTAQARCLDTYVTVETRGTGTDRHTSSDRHVIIGFTTPDGQDVRFRDTSGVPRVRGDRVPMRYLPERPRQAVIADQHPSGVTAPLVAGAVVGLAAVGIGVAAAVAGFGGGPGGAGADAPAPLTSPGPNFPDHGFPDSGWGPSGFPTFAVCTPGSSNPLCFGMFSGPPSAH